ncbi:MAG: DUF3108 domain-containing protein [Candidatus Omnitrophota bacterium]
MMLPKLKLISFTFVFIFSLSRIILAEDIRKRFSDGETLSYKVYFNAVPSGTVTWHYQGRENVGGKVADVLRISSDTSILKFLSLESDERIFLDSQSHLPLQVERDVVFSGKRELIKEVYNQDDGSVRIVRKHDKEVNEEVFKCDKPIHNILALLYFFPKDFELIFKKWYYFNLPTQKVKIQPVSLRSIKRLGIDKECYFIIGRGAKRFSLWLDKETRIPLRLEFIVPVGKITIVRI